MEKLVMPSFWCNKRVGITGHSGFKGSWLSLWLHQLGASIHGYSLAPQTNPALFTQISLEKNIQQTTADIRDEKQLKQWIRCAKPDVVFHLAAQPLVRRSYKEARLTWETNVFGTVNLLEALRTLDKPCAVVIVTTDKVYENLTQRREGAKTIEEGRYGFCEVDKLGGHDPYSSSKSAMELAVSSWRSSFFENDSPISIATVRAGNVIGGGDWADDRIVPDCIRSLQSGESIPVRNKLATRPWQHVLEPLGGYMMLAARIYQASINSDTAALKLLGDAFNFGPNPTSNRTVADIVEEILKHWPGQWEDHSDSVAVYEAELLNLATDKAFQLLKWRPVWNFEQTVEKTVSWYRTCSANAANALTLTARQISDYAADAKAMGVPCAHLL